MGLVYSTDSGRICPHCERPVTACKCNAANANKVTPPTSDDGIVRLQRQTHGRGGKVVTSITGVNLPASELKLFAKRLKQLCGSGGTVSDGTIEIQGDHRVALKSELERLGYKVKLAGG